MEKVMVALSGGVDSAVTAALLIEQGYEVIGVHMRLLSGAEHESSDEDARQVAHELGIEFHSLDCREEFDRVIVQNFCAEYVSGRTPNPCILCNRYMKFGYLLQVADELGIDFLATGHYARIDHSGDLPVLRRGHDRKKDQSYFLFTLTAEQLKRVIFPLESTTKEQVKEVAKRINLSARHKAESQDVCFIPDNDYVSFLKKQTLTLPQGGNIVHVDGKVLGRHGGTYHYTIGQRKGLGIGWSEPLYVVSIDVAKNQVVVGEKQFLETTELVVNDVIWSQLSTDKQLRVDCRIRYRHNEAMATVTIDDQDRVRVVFEQPQIGVTSGQSAVFYQDDAVIGGGWIQ
ncbi:MAG: tRNA 2-thiouridine(34) synthase MnmA [Desulfobacteraceae bacterium 4572_35.2]|nr:MAG: tRNA 2-thiouridine(34) synthase MnmA [Desulfobacteraceae bacterium 4572_35.2]